MRLLKLAVVFGIAAASFSAPLFAKRPVTPEDYFRFQSITDVKLSPDGRQVAYVLTIVNEPRNRRENALWLVASDGRTQPRKLTADGMNSTAPRWSPDGTQVAFLSSRAAEGAAASAEPPGAQIWLLPMNGGEAHVLTHL